MPLHPILIKPVSGLCNMRCDYCFYCDEMEKREVASYGMMSEDTLKNIVKKAMRQARGEICFAFQGGEPTLRGLDFFRGVCDAVTVPVWAIGGITPDNAEKAYKAGAACVCMMSYYYHL